MSAEEHSPPRAGVATVVATAAVTLAVGVTAAALGGFLTPPTGSPSEPTMTETSAVLGPGAEPAPDPVDAVPEPTPAAPAVVLVPIQPESPPVAAPVESEASYAVYEPSPYEPEDEYEYDDDDHHHARGSHEREREHDDD